jgi:hypothetical protein
MSLCHHYYLDQLLILRRLLIILWSSFAILQISRIILSTSIYNVFINITCMCIEITKQTDLWININENILNIIKHWYITGGVSTNRYFGGEWGVNKQIFWRSVGCQQTDIQKILIKYGKRLLDLCNSRELFFVNGRIGNDFVIGKFINSVLA